MDLDTGRLMTQPPNFNERTPRAEVGQWFDQTGADVWCNYPQGKINSLRGQQMKIVEVSNQAWSRLTPPQVVEFLTRYEVRENPGFIIKNIMFTGPPALAQKIDPDILPRTMLFQTREGGRGILQVMGGSIHVKSQPGKGASFTVAIPRPQTGEQSQTTDSGY